MYLILCPTDKRIMHISTTLAYNEVGGLILDSGLQIAPNISEVEQVESVPDYVIPEKYLYIDEEYILNPNWVEPEEE